MIIVALSLPQNVSLLRNSLILCVLLAWLDQSLGPGWPTKPGFSGPIKETIIKIRKGDLFSVVTWTRTKKEVHWSALPQHTHKPILTVLACRLGLNRRLEVHITKHFRSPCAFARHWTIIELQTLLQGRQINGQCSVKSLWEAPPLA